MGAAEGSAVRLTQIDGLLDCRIEEQLVNFVIPSKVRNPYTLKFCRP